jgi:hypothetical protein
MTALPVKVRGVECYLPQLTVEWKCVAGTTGFWFEHKVSMQFMEMKLFKKLAMYKYN